MNRLIALCAVGLVASAPASAASVEWTIDNTITWADGSTLSGSFFFDADTTDYDGSNLVLTCAAPCLNPTQEVSTSGGAHEAVATFTDWSFNSFEARLYFTEDLTNAGGVVELSLANLQSNYPPTDLYVNSDTNFGPYTVSASVVPVPAAVWLFGSALGALGWLRRRKTV